MIVSALVFTIDSHGELFGSELATDPRVQVGQPQSGFLPVVLTTASLREARDAFEEFRGRKGVQDMQLVSWFDEDAVMESGTSVGRSAEEVEA